MCCSSGTGRPSGTCSAAGRAATTAHIIAGRTGLRVTVVDDLAEIHHGDFAGLTNADITRQHPRAADERAKDKYHWRFPNGESYADADHRAGRALLAITWRRPLIVSHEMICRMLLRNLLDEDPNEALRRNQPHDVIHAVAGGTLTTPGTPAGSAVTPPVPPPSR